MILGTICQRDVDTARANESARAAGQRMGARNVGTLVVVDERGRPTGILTDRDLALRLVGKGEDPDTLNVGELMTSDLATVREGGTVEDAVLRMRRAGCRRLPVVDDDGKLVGIVSLDDLFQHFAREFGMLSELLEESSPRSLAGI
jgi:CBS domain-containing protein